MPQTDTPGPGLTAAPPAPARGAPEGATTDGGGARRRWTLLLIGVLVATAILDLATGPATHLVLLLVLLPVMAALLLTPLLTVVLTGLSVAATLLLGRLEGGPLGPAHLPAAVAMIAAGAVATWTAIRRRDHLSLLRQRAEERRQELVESLSLLRATLDSTNDGILVVDRQYRIATCNQKFLDMWQLSPELARAGTDMDLLAAVVDQLADPESFLRRVGELYEHEDAESHDTLRFRDGRIFERFSRPQRIDGRVVGRVWSFRDVTRERQAEQEVREARGRLERLLTSSPAVIFSFRARDGFDVTFISDNVKEQLGWEPAHFLANPGFWKECVFPEDLPARHDWIARLLAAGRYSDELRFRHRDGRVRWLQFEFRVMTDAAGDPDEVVGSSIDVTDRRAAEAGMAELKESLHRSEAMSAIGSLAGGVAHEVRNPLFTISAILDAFEARFGPREEFHQYLTLLRGAVDRLSRLMEQLIDYGKPPAFRPTPCPLADCVREAIQQLPPPITTLGIPVDNEVPADLPTALIDRNRMGQVFQNLLANAVQHSLPGGRVRVSARPLARGETPGLEVRVEDSGPGFKSAEISRIFEPFYSERHGGTGLGLSIVQRIVEQHGGTVEAENREEGGARVRFWIPVVGADGPVTPDAGSTSLEERIHGPA